MALDIHRRNSIAQQGKTPLQKNPDQVHLRDQGPGGSKRSAAQQLPEGGIATVRERKRIPELITGGEAQLREDAVIGASATRVHPWWRGAKERCVTRHSTRLPRSCTFDIQMLTGKKTAYTRNSPLMYPAIGAPMGGLRNTDHAHRWSPWQTLVADGQTVGELGCGRVNPGYRSGRICWKLRRRQVFRL